MLSLALIVGVIGAMIALIIGIVLFSEMQELVDCDSLGNSRIQEQCQSALDVGWVVIGILPIALFFTLFMVFGGIGSYDDEKDNEKADNIKTTLKTLKGKHINQVKKPKTYIRLKSNDKLAHSFITNWFRKNKT